MKRQSVTAIVPAKDEEANIGRCLSSLGWCDRVIVIFDGNDKTGEIAKSMGANVVVRHNSSYKNFELVQVNFNWVVEHAETDWVIRVDADEEVTRELKREIEALLESGTTAAAYGLPRRQYFWGGFLKGGDWAFDRLIRLFKKGSASYDPIVAVHEQLTVIGSINYVKSPLNHYSHATLDEAVRKFNQYTTLEAKSMNLSRKKAVWNMLVQPPYVFTRWMIWHRGYQDGLRGLVAGFMRAWYEFLLYAKYLEKTPPVLSQTDV